MGGCPPQCCPYGSHFKLLLFVVCTTPWDLPASASTSLVLPPSLPVFPSVAPPPCLPLLIHVRAACLGSAVTPFLIQVRNCSRSRVLCRSGGRAQNENVDRAFRNQHPVLPLPFASISLATPRRGWVLPPGGKGSPFLDSLDTDKGGWRRLELYLVSSWCALPLTVFTDSEPTPKVGTPLKCRKISVKWEEGQV